jgi:hypothetical protein
VDKGRHAVIIEGRQAVCIPGYGLWVVIAVDNMVKGKYSSGWLLFASIRTLELPLGAMHHIIPFHMEMVTASIGLIHRSSNRWVRVIRQIAQMSKVSCWS